MSAAICSYWLPCFLTVLVLLFFLSQSFCVFFSLCHRVSPQAALFSLCSPVSECLIALPHFYLQIYAFKLMLIIGVHSDISSSGLLFALVCRNLSLCKVTVMVVLCIFNRISEMMDHCTLPRWPLRTWATTPAMRTATSSFSKHTPCRLMVCNVQHIHLQNRPVTIKFTREQYNNPLDLKKQWKESKMKHTLYCSLNIYVHWKHSDSECKYKLTT